MNDEKLNYVIDMIKDMDLENKLRLAICMCDNYSHTNLEYDKKEIYKKFNSCLRGRVKFPTGGERLFGVSPRAKADLVKFQSRRYSPDERRCDKYGYALAG